MSLGNKLKIAMTARNMTQQELSERSKVGISAIKYISSNRTENPTFDTLCAIADALGVKIEYFRDDENRLPGEVLDLPPGVNEWLLNEDKLGYISVAKEMAEKGITPETAKKIIKQYEELIAVKGLVD